MIIEIYNFTKKNKYTTEFCILIKYKRVCLLILRWINILKI